jgi:hypothetical protein
MKVYTLNEKRNFKLLPPPCSRRLTGSWEKMNITTRRLIYEDIWGCLRESHSSDYIILLKAFFFNFHFEIISLDKKVANTVHRVTIYPSPRFPKHSYFT